MATETLRPNAAGDEENIAGVSGNGVGTHYTTVDEAEPDGDTTDVETSATDYERDLYNLDNHSTGSGTINHITVYANCKGDVSVTQASLKIAIKSGTGAGAPDTPSESAEKTVTTSYAEYSNQWTTNPATTSAWTWDEIDALQAGIALKEPEPAKAYMTKCTQVYVVVDYTVPQNYTESASVAIGIVVTADRTTAIQRTASSAIGIVASAVRVFGAVKTATISIGLVVTADRATAIKRTASTAIGIVASAFRGFTKTASTAIGIAVSASRAVAYKRTATRAIGIVVSATKVFKAAWNRVYLKYRTFAKNLKTRSFNLYLKRRTFSKKLRKTEEE